MGCGQSWSLQAWGKTKTEIVSFGQPAPDGYVGGRRGPMAMSSVHRKQVPACLSTKGPEVSPRRATLPLVLGKVGKHSACTWRGGFPGLSFLFRVGEAVV